MIAVKLGYVVVIPPWLKVLMSEIIAPASRYVKGYLNRGHQVCA